MTAQEHERRRAEAEDLDRRRLTKRVRARQRFEVCSRCHMSGGGDFGRCSCLDGGIVEEHEEERK